MNTPAPPDRNDLDAECLPKFKACHDDIRKLRKANPVDEAAIEDAEAFKGQLRTWMSAAGKAAADAYVAANP